MIKSKNYTSIILALILLVVSASSVVYEAMALKITVLDAMFQLMSDSSGFLTVLCIVIACLNLAGTQKSYIAALLFVVDIVLVNKLYLNTQLLDIFQNIKSYFADLELQTICFYAILILIVIGCFWVTKRKYNKISASVHSEIYNRTSGIVNGDRISKETIENNSAVQDEVLSPSVQETEEASMNSNSNAATDSDLHAESKDRNNPTSGMTSAQTQSFNIVIGICVGIIAIFLARKLISDIPELDFELSQNIGWIFDIFQPFALISIGVLAALFVVSMVVSIKKNLNVDGMRGTALLAVMLEIVILGIIIFSENGLNSKILDKFLNSITNNALIAIVFIPIILFIILHIAVSIVVGSFFSTRDSGRLPAWYDRAKDKVQDIEEKFVGVALNLILGFANFLLFIPDFLNQVCSVLLDKSNFFPLADMNKEKSDKKDKEEHK